jgi:hypothetical protein
MMAPLDRTAIAALTGKLTTFADPDGPAALLDLLRLLYAVGRSDLPLARLFEGHVDALQIVSRLGTSIQVAASQEAARRGAAFGVWNADLPGNPLLWQNGALQGGKAFASGAGVLSHALVSVDGEGGRQLLLIDLDQAEPAIDRSWWQVTGMQRSETHVVRWSGQPLSTGAIVGAAGDYVREPWFSGGAIRFAAVQAGGIAAVVDQARDHLVAQERAADPIQCARLAELFLAAQGAADAVAAAAGHWNEHDVAGTLAHVAAARVAVYEAGERVLTLAQAAVGVQAMFREHPLATSLSDLAVYLRQPGPDAQRARVGRAVADKLLSPTL